MRADFLLDTSFVSALFPGAVSLPDRLDAWVIESQRRFYLPTIAIAEVKSGIAKLGRDNATRRAASYDLWLEQIIELFEDRILALDLIAAWRTGELLDYAVSIGT